MPCLSGHTVTGRFYKNSVLKKVKEFYNKKRPSKGWSGVHLLHDNTSSHKCEVVKSFLASEKVNVLNYPPYSPDLSPCDFFLFPRLKKMLSGNKYTSRSSRTSNLRKLRTVLFVNEWILSYFCVILSGDCVYSCSLLRRFAEICVFTNKFPYIRRNIFVAVYKRTEQSPHSERSTS